MASKKRPADSYHSFSGHGRHNRDDGARTLPFFPLDGVVILSVEQFGAGPWATLQLADLGAEVIKVEDPLVGGDVARYVPPYQEDESSLYFETLNHGKRSISIDLRRSDGRAVFADLVRTSDAVFSNLRADKSHELGLTFGELGSVNPRIVCCCLSAFGMTGPRSSAGSYDYAIQALTGWMSLTGEPDGPPSRTGLSLVDFGTGYVAALALLAGLWRARDTGVGCDCDVSLYETALSLLTYIATWTASRGYEPSRVADSAHPSLVPFQNFRASDGWLVVACGKEKFWHQLCEEAGFADLRIDVRSRDFAARLDNREWLVDVLSNRFRERSVSHWVDLLTSAGVPCAPLNDVSAALRDEQAISRDDIRSYEHPVLGTVRTVNSPLRVGEAPTPMTRAPFRGEDTEDLLLNRCGYDRARIQRLRGDGVFGDISSAA